MYIYMYICICICVYVCILVLLQPIYLYHTVLEVAPNGERRPPLNSGVMWEGHIIGRLDKSLTDFIYLCSSTENQ